MILVKTAALVGLLIAMLGLLALMCDFMRTAKVLFAVGVLVVAGLVLLVLANTWGLLP